MRCRYSPVTVVVLTLVSAVVLSAQTNTFPASGNVGIGTTSPASRLVVAQDMTMNADVSDGAQQVVVQGATTPGKRLTLGYDTNGNGFGYIKAGNLGVAWTNLALQPQGGNVGIGTANPSFPLDVNGAVRALGSAGYLFTSNNSVYLKENNGPQIGLGGSTSSFGANFLNANGASAMYVRSDGSVGIGTTALSSLLHIQGSVSGFLGAAKVVNSAYADNGTTGVHLDFVNDGNTANVGAKLQLVRVGAYDQADLAIFTNTGGGPGDVSTEKMRITSGGNVGIGTTNPTQKLSVAGTIQAREVIVQTGWSDYVFEESYQLSALSETERFIKAKKHLPGIPSAQEVADHGVSMGEMQSKLLAKIEELTLHVIDLKKENDALKARVTHLESTSRP